MKILITAGNTQSPIDRVRCITNIFTGRTGWRIALEACQRRHSVTLITSIPVDIPVEYVDRLCVIHYQTYAELFAKLETVVRTTEWDAIIHSAAVSDYALADVCLPDGTGRPQPIAHAGKISSQHPELWLRLVPTAKIVDHFRTPWGFHGLLVKFKLEVDISDPELIAIAQASLAHSQADLIIANTFADYNTYAYMIDGNNQVTRLAREQLAVELLRWLEAQNPGHRGN